MRPDDLFDRDAEWSDLEHFVTSSAPGVHLGILSGRRGGAGTRPAAFRRHSGSAPRTGCRPNCPSRHRLRVLAVGDVRPPVGDEGAEGTSGTRPATPLLRWPADRGVLRDRGSTGRPSPLRGPGRHSGISWPCRSRLAADRPRTGRTAPAHGRQPQPCIVLRGRVPLARGSADCRALAVSLGPGRRRAGFPHVHDDRSADRPPSLGAGPPPGGPDNGRFPGAQGGRPPPPPPWHRALRLCTARSTAPLSNASLASGSPVTPPRRRWAEFPGTSAPPWSTIHEDARSTRSMSSRWRQRARMSSWSIWSACAGAS